ncbi:AMSH-like protease isoform X2 [Oopsacas minuta]|uniref:AMSH-like protease isoform X2 n=1 Tax=Oopsacas minuta TaxID=111878 RepID=A0AAV7KFM4_9METZ|nr:AMSH-like protease isoform X2 [Oopsacas minuta]
MNPMSAEFAESGYKAWSEFDPSAHVRELSKSGGNVEVDNNLSPARYIRAMNQMEKTSRYYLNDGKHEQAYVLLNKLVTIFVEKLPTHPAYKTLDSKSRAEGNKIVNRAFPIAEDLKSKLVQKYTHLKDNSLKEFNQKLESIASSTLHQVESVVSQDVDTAVKDASQDITPEQLTSEQNSQTDNPSDSATQILIPQSDITPSPSDVPHPESPPPSYSPPSAPTPTAPSRGSVKKLVHSYSKLLTDAEGVDSYITKPLPSATKNDHRSSHMQSFAVGPMASGSTWGAGPLVNPLYSLPSQITSNTLMSPTSNLLTSSISSGLVGLRSVIIPQDIRQKFEIISQTNSNNKVETCGILCGVLKDGEEGESLQVTHLVIPKQKGGPDSCDTLDEHDLFEFQDKNDLITIGWIHTHPTQTAFLSSVDQHTQASYQILLDEAVALVLAPKYNELGVFSLTSPQGLFYVNSCKKPGFHPHPRVPPLFNTCSHVHFSSTILIQIADLR